MKDSHVPGCPLLHSARVSLSSTFDQETDDRDVPLPTGSMKRGPAVAISLIDFGFTDAATQEILENVKSLASTSKV